MKHIAVIGGGSFGSTIAYRLSKHNTVKVYSRNPRYVESVNQDGSCISYPVKFNARVSATTSLENALDNARAILYAVPAKDSPSFISQNINIIGQSVCPIISCSKGLINQEESRRRLMTMQQLFAFHGVDEARYASIAGPSFARSLFNDEPILLSLASRTNMEELDVLWRRSFTMKKTTDVIGQEICGALKNVVAIAAGAASTIGPSAQAAVVGVMWKDVGDLVACLGGKESTISDADMMGDLIGTCSNESRNFRLGVSCAQMPNEDHKQSETVEGYYTLKTLLYDASIRENVPKGVVSRLRLLREFLNHQIDCSSMVNGILG